MRTGLMCKGFWRMLRGRGAPTWCACAPATVGAGRSRLSSVAGLGVACHASAPHDEWKQQRLRPLPSSLFYYPFEPSSLLLRSAGRHSERVYLHENIDRSSMRIAMNEFRSAVRLNEASLQRQLVDRTQRRVAISKARCTCKDPRTALLQRGTERGGGEQE